MAAVGVEGEVPLLQRRPDPAVAGPAHQQHRARETAGIAEAVEVGAAGLGLHRLAGARAETPGRAVPGHAGAMIGVVRMRREPVDHLPDEIVVGRLRIGAGHVARPEPGQQHLPEPAGAAEIGLHRLHEGIGLVGREKPGLDQHCAVDPVGMAAEIGARQHRAPAVADQGDGGVGAEPVGERVEFFEMAREDQRTVGHPFGQPGAALVVELYPEPVVAKRRKRQQRAVIAARPAVEHDDRGAAGRPVAFAVQAEAEEIETGQGGVVCDGGGDRVIAPGADPEAGGRKEDGEEEQAEGRENAFHGGDSTPIGGALHVRRTATTFRGVSSRPVSGGRRG